MNMQNKTKVLIATLAFHTFVKRDVDILRSHFDVKVIHYKGFRSIPKLLKGTIWADLTYSWFADIHAFFAVLFSKIFKKKSIVIVGGYDAAKVPDIDYGLALSPVFFRIVRFVLKKADKILTVDESLKMDAIQNYRVNGTNITTVPTGYDPELWKPHGKKGNRVMTVSHVKEETIKRKGLQTFVLAARHFKETTFILVGGHLNSSIDDLKSISSPNVHFPGPVPNEELPVWYGMAKVYCQLSRYEGLPNSLCEAMLCECVPVGTEYCGIPHAIGDTGFYVPYADVDATVQAVREALKSDKGREARERIKVKFPLEKREKRLVDIINDLIKT
jgi:glycosyltransferase involved in cell wall biosynthesis